MVQFIKGDTNRALESLQHSLTLDPKFSKTYILKGDVLSEAGDLEGALAAYRQARTLIPSDISIQNAIGVLSAQLGDTQGALDAFQQIIDTQTKALANAESQLADLEAAAAAAGGYSALPAAATERRDALQSSIVGYRSKLHLIYRNTALVLRDAGRTAEALPVAQAALALADDSERATIEALISNLSQSLPEDAPAVPKP